MNEKLQNFLFLIKIIFENLYLISIGTTFKNLLAIIFFTFTMCRDVIKHLQVQALKKILCGIFYWDLIIALN